MLNKFFKNIKNRKGASSIEFTYTMLLFLILLMAGLEFFMMGYKYMVVSDFANNTASTLAIQGGIGTSKPTGLSSGGRAYVTSANMNNNIADLGRKIGQPATDITVKVKYQPTGSTTFRTDILSSSSSIEIPYGNRFEVTVSYVFKLQFLQQISSSITKSTTVTKIKGDVSQFEHNYDV